MARIYIEVNLLSIHQIFEFETDDNLNVKEFKNKLIQEMNDYDGNILLDESHLGLYIERVKLQLNEEKTLKENGIVSGDILLVI